MFFLHCTGKVYIHAVGAKLQAKPKTSVITVSITEWWARANQTCNLTYADLPLPSPVINAPNSETEGEAFMTMIIGIIGFGGPHHHSTVGPTDQHTTMPSLSRTHRVMGWHGTGHGNGNVHSQPHSDRHTQGWLSKPRRNGQGDAEREREREVGKLNKQHTGDGWPPSPFRPRRRRRRRRAPPRTSWRALTHTRNS